MKKRLSYAAVFLLLLSTWTSLKSQQVHYHIKEDFSTFPNYTNPFPYIGWSNNIDYGDFSSDYWNFGNPGGRNVDLPGFAEVAIFDADKYSFNWSDENVGLTTPFFDTRGYDDVWVKFDHQFEQGGNAAWEIHAYDGSSWNFVTSGSNQQAWQTDSFDITPYCANLKNARFRFRWIGTWQNNFWWMIDNVQIYSTAKTNNVTVVEAKLQNGLCGSSADNVVVTVRNTSDAALSNIPVKVEINGTINGTPITTTLSGIVAGPLNEGDYTKINLGNFDTQNGGTLEYKAYPEFLGDPSTDYDTVFVKPYTVLGTPASPAPPVFFHCGAGSVTLDGGIQPGNIGYWYLSPNPNQNTHFSTSNKVNTAFLTAPASQTVFLSQARRSSSGYDISNGFNGNINSAGGSAGGNMFTINAISNLEINRFGVNIPSNNFVDVSIYYKTGSYEGFETDASAWTLHGTYNVKANGSGSETFVTIDDLLIPAGQQYSIYILSSDDLLCTSGSTTISNDDLIIDGGNVVEDKFVSSQNDFTWNGTVYYHTFCESSKTAVTGVVLVAPANSGLAAGSTFKGSYRDGSSRVPDLVANPDNIVYNVITPTGFLDKDHGASGTWEITNVDFRTVNGTAVPTADYVYTAPSNAGNGKLSYTPSAIYTDSTLKLSLIIKRHDDQCDTLIERIIYVAPRPDPQFTISNGCVGEEITLNNTSSILAGTISHLWVFADGTTSTYINPVKKYTTAGKYYVKLIITSDLGYKDSLTKVIDIYQIPGTDFTFTNACEGTAITMRDNSILPAGTPTYNWEFASSPTTTATGATTSKLFNAPGIYNTTLTVTINGCTASVTKRVTQAPRVTPSFNFTPTQCDNGKVDFTNASVDPAFGTVNYLWKFGDGAQSTLHTVGHTYNNFNVFNVVLVSNTNLGCVDSTVKQVTLRQSPAAAFTNTTAKCNNEPINFTNGSTVPTGSTNNYVWDFGDGNTSFDQDPIHQYDAPGTYTVVLKSTSTNGCDSKTEVTVTLNLKPTAGFTAADVCKGKETDFKNGSITSDNAALTYAWDFDNGNNSTDANPIVTYASAGTYNVKLTATHTNGCSDVVTVPVNVFALPTADIVSNSRQTGDGAYLFTTNATGTGYSYFWLFGDGGKSYVKDPTYIYNSDGLMIIHLVVTSADGCTNTGSDTVIINRLGINAINGLANAVSVYPNPSSDRFVIDLTKTNIEDITNINVTDMLGRTIVANVTANNAGFAEVNLGSQAAGIYYLNISTTTGSQTVKLNVSR